MQFGDQEEGFDVDNRHGSVVVIARGFWSAELASQLVVAVLPLVRGGEASTRLVLELAELRPLRDEGQAAFKELISLSLSGGMREVVIRSPSALTKLQMLRIAREAGVSDKVRIE